MRLRSILPAASLALALGCANFKPAPQQATLSEAPLAGTELPSGGEWPTASWWERYQDPDARSTGRHRANRQPDIGRRARAF